MIDIEYIDRIEDKYYITINEKFNKFASENGVECNYVPYTFIAKENDEILGLLLGIHIIKKYI